MYFIYIKYFLFLYCFSWSIKTALNSIFFKDWVSVFEVIKICIIKSQNGSIRRKLMVFIEAGINLFNRNRVIIFLR